MGSWGKLWGWLWMDGVCFLGGNGLKTLKTLKTLCLSRVLRFKWVLSVLSGNLKPAYHIVLFTNLPSCPRFVN